MQTCKYLSVEELEVTGEEDVAEAALRWLNACPCTADRQSDIVTVLASIRLEYLDAGFVLHRILNDRVTARIAACRLYSPP